MRGLFVVAAIAASHASAQNAQDENLLLREVPYATSQYAAGAFQPRVIMEQPAAAVYADPIYQPRAQYMVEGTHLVEQPHFYGQPHYVQEPMIREAGARYISVPDHEVPEIRYVQVP